MRATCYVLRSSHVRIIHVRSFALRSFHVRIILGRAVSKISEGVGSNTRLPAEIYREKNRFAWVLIDVSCNEARNTR